MLLSLIRMIQAFRDYQRNVSELSQLSDRELANRPRSFGHSARCRRDLCRLISVRPPDERITPALLRALSFLAFSSTRFLDANRHPLRSKTLWQVHWTKTR